MSLEVKLDYMTLVGRLAEELKKRGISRTDVAKSLGLAPSSVSQKMHGKRPFYYQEWLAICEFAGIYPCELYPDEVLSYALKRLSLFEYIEQLVKGEVKRTMMGEERLQSYDIIMRPKKRKREIPTDEPESGENANT